MALFYSSVGPAPAARITHAYAINRNAKALAREIAALLPADPQIGQASRRVHAAIDADPLAAAESVGPHLYQYRAQIYSEDPEAFFTLHAIAAADADISYLVRVLKEIAPTTPAEKKKYCLSLVVGMLDSYLEYLSVDIPAEPIPAQGF